MGWVECKTVDHKWEEKVNRDIHLEMYSWVKTVNLIFILHEIQEITEALGEILSSG